MIDYKAIREAKKKATETGAARLNELKATGEKTNGSGFTVLLLIGAGLIIYFLFKNKKR